LDFVVVFIRYPPLLNFLVSRSRGSVWPVVPL
jgi:hypothetical protein